MKTAKKHAGHGITGFEFSKKVLHNLKHFRLTPSAKLVLWVLSDCYNPENGSVVFPSIEFIAEIADIGLTSAKQAIKELINKGLIIKSKRDKVKGNYNKYLLTPKVQNPAYEQSENELFKQSDFDCFMIRTNKKEQIKEQTTKENVVAFSSKHKVVKIEDVPEIIRSNKKVKNPCAYWASLSSDVKADYLEGRKDEKADKEKRAADKYFERQIKETEERNAQNRIWTAVSPKECNKLKEVLFNNWGIKK